VSAVLLFLFAAGMIMGTGVKSARENLRMTPGPSMVATTRLRRRFRCFHVASVRTVVVGPGETCLSLGMQRWRTPGTDHDEADEDSADYESEGPIAEVAGM
jgi:hypothetical protein